MLVMIVTCLVTQGITANCVYRSVSAHADRATLLKVPIVSMKASKLDHGAMEVSGLWEEDKMAGAV